MYKGLQSRRLQVKKKKSKFYGAQVLIKITSELL